MLIMVLIRALLLAPIGYAAYKLYKSLTRKKISVGTLVLLQDGRGGKVLEIVRFEDMTLYAVRSGDEVNHFKREQLIKKL